MASHEKRTLEDCREQVSLYYSVITEPYRRLWGDYFHPAIYENPEDSLETALEKTHRRFIRDSHIQSGGSALDLGCGIGSFSCLLAESANCQVVGVNICDFQLRKARALAKNKALENVVFENLEIMDVARLQKKFDAAFLIDVGCHLYDKEKALAKVYEVLRERGRLVIADWLERDHLNSFEKELLIDPMNRYWNFPYMESLGGYERFLKRIGFKIILAEDVSEQTRKNWERFYKIALDEVGTMSIKKLISYVANPSVIRHAKKSVQLAKNQFYANVFTKVCFEAGVFRYGYLVVEK